MKAIPSSLLAAALAVSLLPSRADIPGDVTYFPMFSRSEVPLASPVYFNEMPGKPGTFVVLEQGGEVSVILRENGKWAKKEFLKVNAAKGSEVGLLGFAFHPHFATNRKYYLNYNDPSTLATLIEERTADGTFLKDAGAAPRRILRVEQPATNHKGGTLAFGPKDGFLYVGMGDGGNNRNGQDKTTLLGKFLRLDIDAPDTYRIPADNPFVGEAGTRGEIWALGLRNPWKWSLDPVTGELWAGDVGTAVREEISLVGKGENLGWAVYEGNNCDPYMGTCPGTGYRAPVLDLARGYAFVIIGGVVYRGNPASAWHGLYFFADINAGSLWALRQAEGKLVEYKKLKSPPDGLSSFGTDAAGNIYAVGYYDGLIHRLDSDQFGPASARAVPGRDRFLRGLVRVRAGQAWSLGGGAGTVRIHRLDGSLAAVIRADDGGWLPPLRLPAGIYRAGRAGSPPGASRPLLVH